MQKLISGYDIRTPGPRYWLLTCPEETNKSCVSKEFDRTPEILVVVQPTRGLDIGAREYVHEELLTAEKGCCYLTYFHRFRGSKSSL